MATFRGPQESGYRSHGWVALRDQRRRTQDAEVRGLRNLCKEKNTGQGPGQGGEEEGPERAEHFQVSEVKTGDRMEVGGLEERSGIRDQDRTSQAQGFSLYSIRDKNDRLTEGYCLSANTQTTAGLGEGLLDHLISNCCVKWKLSQAVPDSFSAFLFTLQGKPTT